MKILVIDDHPLFFDGLQQVLALMDERVRPLHAFSAEEAFASLDQEAPVELILVDFTLPGLHGIDFLRLQREREPSIPAVLISAHDDTAMVYEALTAGACGFIPKSFRAAELMDAVRRILAGEIFLPPYMKQPVEQYRRRQNKDAASSVCPAEDAMVTVKQRRIIELVAQGLSNRDIALALHVSEHTVKSHLKTVYRMFQVNSRTQCVKYAERQGIIGPHQGYVSRDR